MRGRRMLCVALLLLSAVFAATAILRTAQNQTVEQEAQLEVQQVLETTEGESWYGEEYCAILEIPELELVLPVLDHYTEAEMKRTPCLYSGSLETEDAVITAHNYRHHFGRLGELEQGAELILRLPTGQIWRYRLDAIEELSTTDVEAMIHSEWPLTLYTCTYDQRAMLTLRWVFMEKEF